MPPHDVIIHADVTVTVGQLAARLLGEDVPERDVTLRVHHPGEPVPVVLDPLAVLPQSQLRPGSRVQAVPVAHVGVTEARAYVIVAACTDSRGHQWPLVDGPNLIGRDRGARIWLASRTVSRKHAKIVIDSGEARITDLGAVNGIDLNGHPVSVASLRNGDVITLGNETLQFRWMLHTGEHPRRQPVYTDHVRPPRIETYAPSAAHTLPAPPEAPRPQRLPMLAVLAPMLMGAASFAFTLSLQSLILVGLSPLIMLGSWLDGRIGAKHDHARAMSDYHKGMERLEAVIVADQRREADTRNREVPGPESTGHAVVNCTDLLWTRRPEHSTFFELRVGTGRDRSRTTISLPERGAVPDREWVALENLRDRHTHIDPVPLLVSFPESGGFGIVGYPAARDGLMRASILHLAALHAPSEIVFAVLAADAIADRWQWLKWLPHADAPQSPLAGAHLARGPIEAGRLLSRLEELVEMRARSGPAPGFRSHLPRDHRVGHDHGTPISQLPITPALVVFILGDPGVDAGRLVQLAERGPDSGVYTLWMRETRAELPAACRTYVHFDPDRRGSIGYVREADQVVIGTPDCVDVDEAGLLARRLAAINDAGARMLDESDLPRRVSLRELSSYDLIGSPQGVVASWASTDSLKARWQPGGERAAGTIPAVVGVGADGPLTLDLRDQGPHALVGGTTGSGKSEFLQTWIMSMAASHSPDRLTFLLVDYKGGSAFAKCVELPHTVGLVTDLSPHLVYRALTSLRAELTYREHIFNEHGVKDLVSMERRSDPDAPPILVIVIDEFAALAADVPEFVDGVIDVAARGRSLGVHLIMATQRPGGVIKDNLRANTNLRIALRMADPGDSNDVIDTEVAAHFDPSTPGRAAVRVGPGRIAGFQTAYIGAPVQQEASSPDLIISELPFGPGKQWSAPFTALPTTSGPREIEVLLDHIRQAAARLRIAPPRRPWLDELPTVVSLTDLPGADHVGEDRVTPQHASDGPVWGIGIQDDPVRQAQHRWDIHPEKDGPLCIIGMAASGKSATLRTIAAAAIIEATMDAPVWIYGLTSAGGLSALEPLTSYGGTIKNDDNERVPRLLRWLVDLAKKRTAKFSRLNITNLSEYLASTRSAVAPDPGSVANSVVSTGAHFDDQSRQSADTGTADADPPGSAPMDRARIVLLVDGFAQLREHWEYTRQFDFERTFDDLLCFGPHAGVHVVLTADRRRAMPTRYDGYFGTHILLKVPDGDVNLADVPKGFFDDASAGRGFAGGLEAHVALLGAATTAGGAAEAFAALAERTDRLPQAPSIRLLPERIPLVAIDPMDLEGNPAFAIADDDFNAVGMPLGGLVLVQGRAKSGATTALRCLARAAQRSGQERHIVWLRPEESGAGIPEGIELIVGESDAARYLNSRLDPQGECGKAGDDLIVVEHVTEYYDTDAEKPLEAVLRLAQRGKVTVIVEADPGLVGNSWDIHSALRGARIGLLLRPEDGDGYTVLRMDLPREDTAVFPPGRGYLINGGAIRKVQVAFVDD